MTTVSAIEVRRNLGRLLNIVSLRHEELIIERAGKPVARLSPIGDAGPPAHEGKLDIRRSRGLGKALWRSIDVQAYLAGERRAWD
ncbi:MAG: type II toxin-antitoxin system Phd/YefM family antitoxin [Verrucomicrobia bacterium]|nr:type II toxin-antitoxin system Phd/YefM family antitoxin [Verrucomicrobiota bacterium]